MIVFLYSSFLKHQALSLLLALVLRGMVSTHKADYDVEDDYDFRGRTREPLLNNQLSQASGSTKGDGRGTHSDIWSSRIRDKVFCLKIAIIYKVYTLIPICQYSILIFISCQYEYRFLP